MLLLLKNAEMSKVGGELIWRYLNSNLVTYDRLTRKVLEAEYIVTKDNYNKYIVHYTSEFMTIKTKFDGLHQLGILFDSCRPDSWNQQVIEISKDNKNWTPIGGWCQDGLAQICPRYFLFNLEKDTYIRFGNPINYTGFNTFMSYGEQWVKLWFVPN